VLSSGDLPLVRIDVLTGYWTAQRKSIGDWVQRAMTATLGVPGRDRFQLITEHEPAVALRGEDLAIVLVENERPDWSFDRGEARYVVIPREDWR
jgi:hypothetical protein